MSEKKRISLISLGCSKNLVDSEILIGGLKQENYEIVQKSESTPHENSSVHSPKPLIFKKISFLIAIVVP